jgi:UDP-glucose 4-epimerase
VRWLITGGYGFIGANLVADLLAAGGQEVRVLDDRSAGAGSLRALGVDATRLDLWEADVRDAAAMSEAARGADAVVHRAGATGVAGSLADPGGDARANVLGTLGVLEAARTTGARVVLASTTAPLTGDAPALTNAPCPVPRVPNGPRKLVAEAYCNP